MNVGEFFANIRKIIKGISLTLLIWINISVSQNVDSSYTSIDSLLQLNIEKRNYVISASKYSQSIEEAPYSISILSSSTVEKYGYDELTEVLNTLNGFYLTNDLQYTYIGTRGFGRPADYNNRILILYNGITINDNIFGAAFLDMYSFNIEQFENIEVVRGTGSSLYGTSAMFGIINLVPKKLNSYKPKISLSYGTFNSMKLGLLWGKNLSDEIAVNAGINYYKSDGGNYYFKEFDFPTTLNGIANNKDAEKYIGYNFNLNYKDFDFQLIGGSRNKQVPTAPRSADFNSLTESTESFVNVALQFKKKVSYNKSIGIKAYYHTDIADGLFPTQGIENRYDAKSEALTFEGKFIWDVSPRNRTVFGIDYKNAYKLLWKFYNPFYVTANIDTEYENFSLYVQNEYLFNEMLSATVGLRFDHYLDIENQINPRLAILYSPSSKWTFKGIYGSAFRIPNPFERTYEEYFFPTIVSKLKSEKLTNYEFISYYKFNERFNIEMLVYYNEMKDLIDAVIDPKTMIYHHINKDKNSAIGYEIQLMYQNKNKFGGFIRGSYCNLEDGNGNELTNSPRYMVKSGIHLKLFDPLNISILYFYEDGRLTLGGLRTKATNKIDVNLFTDRILENISFSLKINNLLNSKIYHPGSFYHIQQSLLQPGRSIQLKIRYGY